MRDLRFLALWFLAGLPACAAPVGDGWLRRIPGLEPAPVVGLVAPAATASQPAPPRGSPRVAEGTAADRWLQPPRVAFEGGGWMARPVAAAVPVRNVVGRSYTRFKLGTFETAGDFSSLDVGTSAEVVFGRQFLKFLSVEGAVGYLQADGSAVDLKAIPAFLQARLSLPILVLEPYVGVGVGGAYVEISGGGSSVDDFVGASCAFLGVDVGLGKLSIGLEGKYLVTDAIDQGGELEGTAVTLNLSLPF